MYILFLKVASLTQESEKVCLRVSLVKNNQVTQSVKFVISSMPHMHIHDLSRPALS